MKRPLKSKNPFKITEQEVFIENVYVVNSLNDQLFLFDIKSTKLVFIDALRNISLSELKYASSKYDDKISNCQLSPLLVVTYPQHYGSKDKLICE